MLRNLFLYLPSGVKHELRRYFYRAKIHFGRFISSELEFDVLSSFIMHGDKVVDVGANIGHYTLLLSKLVGPEGRVVAFEPICSTFDLLSSNVEFSNCPNVTLVNAAVNDSVGLVSFSVPQGNFYRAHMTESGEKTVMAYPIERFLEDDARLSFIKIDAEGCDDIILESSIKLIQKSRPIIMAELPVEKVAIFSNRVESYSAFYLPGSHNSFCVPAEQAQKFSDLGMHQFTTPVVGE